MKSVLVRIKQYLPDSTIAEQGVLNYILANPDKAVQHNIHQLSEYSYSSASTIVRLCRKLGFQGYRDLQNSLLSELVVQKQDRNGFNTWIPMTSSRKLLTKSQPKIFPLWKTPCTLWI